MSEWVNEYMSEWVNEYMSEWVNEYMSEYVNFYSYASLFIFCLFFRYLMKFNSFRRKSSICENIWLF